MNNYLRYGSVLLLSISLFSIRYFFPQGDSAEETNPVCNLNARANGPVKPFDPFEFPYDVRTQYYGIPLNQLQNAEKLDDFLGSDYFQNVSSIEEVRLHSVINGKFSEEYLLAPDNVLTAEQKEYFANAKYGQNFTLLIECYEFKEGYDEPIADRFTPHLSVVPAKEAYYKDGQDKLIDYIREQNKEFTKNYSEKDLNPARIQFVINTEGKLENVELLEPSGIPSIDLNLVKILNELPGEWQPAFNAKGEKVAQPLLLLFGPQGC